MTRRQTALMALVLVILALALRLPSLGSSLTPDERFWSQGTTQFITALDQHHWIGTLTSGHPGVTVMWAGTAGVVLKALLDPPADAGSLPQLVSALSQEPSRVDLIPWLRLPIVLITLAGILVITLLARQLLGRPAALLGAALMCFDPFLLAHSRVLQMDALLATFVTIAWLALLVATLTGRHRYFIVCGIAAALGFLTKAPALVLGPPVLGWILLQRWRSQPARPRARRLGSTLAASFVDLLWIGIPALLTVWLVWPALWTAPLDTLIHVWRFAAGIGGIDHELGNFWLGKPVGSPGALFYPAVLLWRTTPISLIGLLLAVLALIWPAWRNLRQGAGYTNSTSSSSAPVDPAEIPQGAERQAAWALIGFVIWFALAMSLGAKAFDRYLLPVFPIVDLLAAWGWLRAIRWLMQGTAGLATRRSPSALVGFVLAGVLVVSQAAFAVSNRPTYLTAYNPLLGGINTARQVMPVGWGEGLAEAARFLNEQQEARNLRVAAWYGHNVFGPFFVGESYDLYYDLPTAADLYANDVDYVVTYVNQLQRQLLDTSIAGRLPDPVMESSRSGVPLAQVYPWPKPFAHTADKTLSNGLRLLGWEIGPYDPDRRQVPVRLYWDAAEAASASGELVPVSGLAQGRQRRGVGKRRRDAAGRYRAPDAWLGRSPGHTTRAHLAASCRPARRRVPS